MNLNILPGGNPVSSETKPEEKVSVQNTEEIIQPNMMDMIPTIDEAIINDLEEDPEYVVLDNSMDTTKEKIHFVDYDFSNKEFDNIFFGKSKLFSNDNKINEESDLFDIFNFYRKESLYVDVYLPMTNVAVRIYEFNNLNILINKFTQLSEKDFQYKSSINVVGTQTKEFVEQIFDNADFLVSNRKNLTKAHFELISQLDVPFLVLAATKLLQEIYYQTDGRAGQKAQKDVHEDSREKWTDTCPNCGTEQWLNKDITEILQAQYTPEMIKYANENYDPNDTLENNVGRSLKVRAKGVRYTKGNSGKDTIILLADPDWSRGYDYDRLFDNYIVDKYSNHKLLIGVKKKRNDWNVLAPREKSTILYNETNRLVEVIRRRDALDQEELDSLEGSEAEIWDLSGNFNLDIQNFTLIKYIHSIKVVDTKILNENGKPKEIKTEDMSGYSLAAKMQLLEKYLDTDTTNRLFQRLEEIRNQGRTTIEYTYKCVKCGEETKTYLDPAMFVFVILQSLVFKIGNQ